MAERKKKGVVAPKYQQTVSRATPQAITALVKKLPAEAGPIEARKKALYDLTLMISNVTQQDQDALLKTSEEHNLVGILATLLKDAEEAEREAEQAGEEAQSIEHRYADEKAKRASLEADVKKLQAELEKARKAALEGGGYEAEMKRQMEVKLQEEKDKRVQQLHLLRPRGAEARLDNN